MALNMTVPNWTSFTFTVLLQLKLLSKEGTEEVVMDITFSYLVHYASGHAW